MVKFYRFRISSLCFNRLRDSMFKGSRTGSWLRLSRAERSLYVCILSRARMGYLSTPGGPSASRVGPLLSPQVEGSSPRGLRVPAMCTS
ncbi:MAG: hypothetical protein QXE79_06800 [Candidatus Bathyarchaeia archaeon]